jgi:hypothetical protein
MRDTWEKILGEGIAQGIPVIVAAVAIFLLLLYWMLNVRAKKGERKVRGYKQSVYDRWHDRDRY